MRLSPRHPGRVSGLKAGSISVIALLNLFMPIDVLAVPTEPVALPKPADVSETPPGGTYNSAVHPLEAGYQSLKTMWDCCWQLENISEKLLVEGKNSAPRQSWLDYYVDSLDRSLTRIEAELAHTTYPDEARSALEQPWSDVKANMADLRSKLPELKDEIAKVTGKTENAYPPPFWAPAREIRDGADKLNQDLLKILSTLESTETKEAPGAESGAAAVTRGETVASDSDAPAATRLEGGARKTEMTPALKSVDEAAQQILHSCTGLIGELERWNLLWGKPPSGGIGDMFYGGGLTKQEVLTQYRYLPTTVFTMPAYVKLYSYRLPPRQNMLAHFTTEIGKTLNLMQSELDAMEPSEDRNPAVQGPWQQLAKVFIDTRNQYLALVKLVDTTPDKQLKKSIREDQVTIGVPVLAIYNNMGDLRKLILDMKAVSSVN